MPDMWPGPPGKKALVLSGGAAQGDFEVGVVRWLFDNRFYPDLLMTTSVGSVNGVKLVEQKGDPSELEALWLEMQSNDEMYEPNPAFDTQEVKDALGAIENDWWAKEEWGVGAVGTLTSGTIFWVISLAQVANQLKDVKHALDLLINARSLLLFNPLREKLSSKLDIPLVQDPRNPIDLLMATVSLEAGDLRYVDKMGAVWQADAVTPYAEYASVTRPVDPACRPLERKVKSLQQGLKEALENRGDYTPGGILLLRNNLALAERELAECEVAHHDIGWVPVPLTGVSLVDAVIASSSVPCIFEPVKLGAQNYVDGGVRAPVPIRGAVANAATNIWAVQAYHVGEVGPAEDPITERRIYSFDQANWAQAAVRAAKDILPTQIVEDDIDPPNGWGSPSVTIVQPEIDIHDGLSIDPGLIAIRMAHGYMRADDVNSARWLAHEGLGTGRYQNLVDKVSAALHTTEIVKLRFGIWMDEHDALGMKLNYGTGGTVVAPTITGWIDEAKLNEVREAKQRLAQLVVSRKTGVDADGVPIKIDGINVQGLIPDQPDWLKPSGWWLNYERHQPPLQYPWPWPHLPPAPVLWPSGFTPLRRRAAMPEAQFQPAPPTMFAFSCLTPGASIYYTLDRSDPTGSATAKLYNGGWATFADWVPPKFPPLLLKAVAKAVGFEPSPVLEVPVP